MAYACRYTRTCRTQYLRHPSVPPGRCRVGRPGTRRDEWTQHDADRTLTALPLFGFTTTALTYRTLSSPGHILGVYLLHGTSSSFTTIDVPFANTSDAQETFGPQAHTTQNHDHARDLGARPTTGVARRRACPGTGPPVHGSRGEPFGGLVTYAMVTGSMPLEHNFFENVVVVTTVCPLLTHPPQHTLCSGRQPLVHPFFLPGVPCTHPHVLFPHSFSFVRCPHAAAHVHARTHHERHSDREPTQ
jgi:hypothetical protein